MIYRWTVSGQHNAPAAIKQWGCLTRLEKDKEDYKDFEEPLTYGLTLPVTA